MFYTYKNVCYILNYYMMIHRIKHKDICHIAKERNIEEIGKRVGC
jgi:hypothetical protein